MDEPTASSRTQGTSNDEQSRRHNFISGVSNDVFIMFFVMIILFFVNVVYVVKNQIHLTLSNIWRRLWANLLNNDGAERIRNASVHRNHQANNVQENNINDRSNGDCSICLSQIEFEVSSTCSHFFCCKLFIS